MIFQIRKLPCYVPLFTSSNGTCCDEKTILTYKQGFGYHLQQILKSLDSASIGDTKRVQHLISQKHLPVCSTRAPFFVIYSFKPSKGTLCKRCQRWLTLLDVLQHKQ